MFKSFCAAALLSFSVLQAFEPPARFEGLYGAVTDSPSTIQALCKRNVGYFVPYNPTILIVGGYEGAEAKEFAEAYPKGRILVFEPNPRAFKEMLKNLEGLDNVTPCNCALSFYPGKTILHFPQKYGPDSLDSAKFDQTAPAVADLINASFESLATLLEKPASATGRCREPSLEVSCVLLDDWCKENQIAHIDLIRLDTEGFELQVLESSPEILKTVQVIWTKTHFYKPRVGTTQYDALYRYLDGQGFRILSHWYREGTDGDAIFIRKTIYESLFY